MTTRVLVCYVTAGAGHRRAAEAIAQALARQCPDTHVETHNVLHDTPAWFHAGYSRTYLFLVRHLSWVWRLTYFLVDWRPIFRLVQPIRRRWNLAVARPFVRRLKEDPPDLVVSTHFLPADLCREGKRAGWLRIPAVVVVTDLHPHRFWVAPECEAVVVGTPESAAVCVARGIAGDRVHVLGIPVAHAFGVAVDRARLQHQCGLHPQRRTVLVTSGGTTVGRFERVVQGLAALEQVLPGMLQLLVVCGEDRSTRQRLAASARRLAMPLRVFGFVDNMAELMALSDLIVAKAGGLTVSEALARGVPLILYHAIPGQERVNARYVARHGAALVAARSHDVPRLVRQCVEDPARLAAMREAARALARPHAADDIAREVIRPLLNRTELSH